MGANAVALLRGKGGNAVVAHEQILPLNQVHSPPDHQWGEAHQNRNQLGISWDADAFADGSAARLERFEREIPHVAPTPPNSAKGGVASGIFKLKTQFTTSRSVAAL